MFLVWEPSTSLQGHTQSLGDGAIPERVLFMTNWDICNSEVTPNPLFKSIFGITNMTV